MRVLVLTNHFSEFAGSEIVALEVATWFQERGDDVTLCANHIAPPIATHVPERVRLTQSFADVDLSSFDLVWCQHGLLSEFPLKAFEWAIVKGRLPHIVLVSLSPFEPYERIDGVLARALSAEIFVNSRETGQAVMKANRGLLRRSKLTIFHNAAPAAFWSIAPQGAASAPTQPGSVALISNRAPAQNSEIARHLESAGVRTQLLGCRHKYGLVRPRTLASVDAVLTIGKSVTYAFAAGKPAYIYDRFGGGGWLTRRNFAANMDHNFSGRPSRRQIPVDEIVREILSGYARAVSELEYLRRGTNLRRFLLDSHLTRLRDRAFVRQASGASVGRLCEHLRHPRLRESVISSLDRGHARQQAFLTDLHRPVPLATAM